MLFPTLLASLAVSGVAGHAVIRSPALGNWCGTPRPSAEQIEIAKELAVKEATGRIAASEAIVVDTYFHIVSTSTRESDGYLSEATVDAQLDVMNDNYASTGISFRLKNVTRTVNSRWATDASELAMKKALRQGDYSTLNVYFQTSASGYLGYCYFPEPNITVGSDDFYLDGCTILASSVPGGPETNYDEGKTATHEIGHWFGLYHTFQGGCSGDGDFVSDTPSQSSPTSGCPTTRDSCPAAGIDPIHNYMDYSYDVCMTEFTTGQGTRMASFWRQYRLSGTAA